MVSSRPSRGALTAIAAMIALVLGYVAADIASGADGSSPGSARAVATTVRRASPTATRTPGATLTATARPTATATPPPARAPVLITTTPLAQLATSTVIPGAPQPTATAVGAQPADSPTAAAQATPTAAPTVTPAVGLTPTPIVYVIQANDTLWALSQRYGVSVDDILAANNLTRQDVLQIGQRITIPPKR